MFENLIKDDKKLNSGKESGGMKRISVNSDNSFETVETNGSALIQTEELQEKEVEATTTTNQNGEKVIELNSGEPIGDSDLMRDSLSVDPTTESAQKWFNDAELSAIENETEQLSEDEKESITKVKECLDSPDWPNTRREIWTRLCREEGKGFFSQDRDYDKELTEKEKDKQMVESLRERGYDVEPEHPENKNLSEATLGEIKEAINGDSEAQEELESEPQEEETEPEVKIEELEDSVKSEAASAFQERDKEYWHDIAEELQIDIPNTKVEPAKENGKKKLTTTNPTMIEELKRVHKSDEYDTSLEKKGEGHYVGVIPTGVEY